MKPHFSPGLPVLIILLLLGCQINLDAATKYVSNAGSNSNSGNSWDQSWATLQWAEDHIAAGDTVWVANGTYTGFDVRITGTAANPIVFIGAGNNVIINAPTGTTDGINVENADYIEINGFRVINMPRNGIRLVNADNCIVRNNYCESNFERGIFTGFTDDILIEYNECLTSDDEHGIYVSNSSDRSIIRYNICHHNNRGGIQINADGSQGGDGISTDPEIYGNILYENGAAGGAAINLDGVQGAFIYNNLLYENHASGIALFQQDGNAPSINATIVHNTIVNDSNARWCVLIVNGATGAKVYNNILLNQHPWRGSIALDADAVTGFDSDYNILVNSLSRNGDGSSVTFAIWQGYGYDEHSQLADSQYEIFMSPESGQDYHLAEGSQAIESGSADFAFGVDDDLEGNSRPQGSQHDIGTYESTLPLAIDEEAGQTEDENPNPGIIVGPDDIKWPDGLEGNISLLNAEGKLLRTQEAREAGSLSFQNLIPGIYILVLSDANGVQWSQQVVVSQ